MRQTLFYIPTQLGGYPLFGVGILFWIILVVGAITVVRALVKRKFDDLIFYAAITAIGLFLVKTVGPFLAEKDGFPIRGYGVMLMLAIVLSTLLTVWRGKRKWNYPSETILGIVLVCAVFGIIGARGFYVAQYWSDFKSASMRETLINVLNVANGGLVVYGSMIGGALACLIYLFLKKLPIAPTLDLFAPALMLGVAIGRIGCFLNGCCFGGPCDAPWSVVFPQGSPAYMQQLDEGRISLYGITLQPPESNDASDEQLFSLKSKRVNLATEEPSDVVIAKIDSDSEAERCGLLPGMKIREIGIAPKNFFANKRDADFAVSNNQIQRFRLSNNAQLFYFFTNIWSNDPDEDVWLVAEEEDSSGEDGVHQHKFRNFIFHPNPTTALPVHPTQIYSSIAALILCCALLIVSKLTSRDGVVFSLAMVLYPIERFAVEEMLRSDEESFRGTGLTVSQCVSVCILALGLALFVTYLVKKPQRALEGFFPVKEETGTYDG